MHQSNDNNELGLVLQILGILSVFVHNINSIVVGFISSMAMNIFVIDISQAKDVANIIIILLTLIVSLFNALNAIAKFIKTSGKDYSKFFNNFRMFVYKLFSSKKTK
jgi:hypothetical protein